MDIYNPGMPRSRTVTDGEILDGVARALGRVGPAKLTLSTVGQEVGLSPATLLQRFGSKRGLLLALVQANIQRDRARFLAIRKETPSPLHVLQRLLIEGAASVLLLDLSDPVIRRSAIAHSTLYQQELARLLDQAVQAGEIVPTDTGRLAQALYAIWNGAILQWDLHRGGSLDLWLKASLEVLLAPYLALTTGNGPSGAATVPN